MSSGWTPADRDRVRGLTGEVKNYVERREPVAESDILETVIDVCDADQEQVEAALEDLIRKGEVYRGKGGVKTP
jgi:hypothetical protein